MLSVSKSLLVVAGSALLGSLFALPTHASGTLEWSSGNACQLSLPTTDTMVRPRANGYRNEGTTTQFVLCGLGGYPAGSIMGYSLFFTSVDGAAHTINCTAVGGSTGSAGPYYSTKTITIQPSGYSYLYWGPEDFLAPVGKPIPYDKSINASVTCNLPAKGAIQRFESLVQ